jgi:dTDP-4-dehydrorhamnose 3,5-epimerase
MAVLEASLHCDARGSFARLYCREALRALGVEAGIEQANLSFSERRGTLRGLHWQAPPGAESKLVACLQGGLLDVVLDMRPGSPTFGRHAMVELTPETQRAVLVPEGCAHGFLTLRDATQVLYLVTAPHDPAHERAVRWDDPAFAIPWPFRPEVISPRDATLPDFAPAA